MADDVVIAIPAVEPAVPAEPQFTETEQKAIDSGWTPKDQWKGDLAEHRSAKEWVERGEILGKLDYVRRSNELLQRKFNSLQRHHQTVFEAATKRAMADLKAAHRNAVRAGDLDAADRFVDQIEKTKEVAAAQTAELQANEQQVPPEYQDFAQRNPWYNTNSGMTAAANAFGAAYIAEEPDKAKADPTSIFKVVETRMREQYPQLFGRVRTVTAPDPVAPAASPIRRSSKEFGWHDLTEEEQTIAKEFEATDTMTRAKYVAEIKKMRGIK